MQTETCSFLSAAPARPAGYENGTFFFLPFRFKEYSKLIPKINADSRWKEESKDDRATAGYGAYLQSHIVGIADNTDLYRSFVLNESELPQIAVPDKAAISPLPALRSVRISLFSTNIGFLEYHIVYGDGTAPEALERFAYYFKKAAMACTEAADCNCLRCASERLLPEDAILFFTDKQPKKYECKCLHCVKLCRASAGNADSVLLALRRTYSSTNCPHPDDTAQYDMEFRPYDYDFWAGSTEALASVSVETEDEGTNKFLRTVKYRQLTGEYRFLYLLLLNQRFSALRYIADISDPQIYKGRDAEKINQKVIELKTQFSFRIVSDDMLFQSVYAKMFSVMQIDELLRDVEDNENQITILRQSGTAKTEQLTSKFLAGLSVMSLFSALMDAAGYFDRVSWLKNIATPLSLLCSICIFVIVLV